MKNLKSSSWFIYSAKRLSKYNIDAIQILSQETTYVKIKSTISNYWTNFMRTEAATKTSLRYLDPERCDFQSPHSIWTEARSDPAEIKKAIQKARLLTGTYLLQSNKAVFNQHQTVATCPLCNTAAEDREHFILECPTLQKIRGKHFIDITRIVPTFDTLNHDQQLRVILDSHIYPFMECNRADLEASCRSFLFSIHCKRTHILNGS